MVLEEGAHGGRQVQIQVSVPRNERLASFLRVLPCRGQRNVGEGEDKGETESDGEGEGEG